MTKPKPKSELSDGPVLHKKAPGRSGNPRIKRGQWDLRTREKIETSKLVSLLHRCADGQLELSLSRLRAIEILLRKVLPDLATISVQTDVAHRYVAELPNVLSRDEWEKLYGQDHLALPDHTNRNGSGNGSGNGGH